jgi:hypothetical protein
MTNLKQQQLADDFFQSVKTKFPEVELINITSSPEDPRDLWINVTAPADEAREFELMDWVSEKSADILLEYGYSILVIPDRN